MEKPCTEPYINHLPSDHIFVFGSNLEGIHGAGAAHTARVFFNAESGIGKGLTGQAYAIPTKSTPSKTLGLKVIESYVNDFIRFVNQHEYYTFHVTPIGCGYAGYEAKDIAPMFESLRFKENVYLPQEFINIYNKQ